MKVDIIYRCCDKELTPDTMRPERPDWFSKRACFLSARNMIQSIPGFSLHVIYDGEDSSLLDLITHCKPDSLIRIKGGSSAASIAHQWPIADAATGEHIYFLEDDYMHTASAAYVFMEAARKVELFTLYDHPDRYTRTDDLMKDRESVSITRSRHWRTAESTTSTWACSRRLWNDGLKDAAIPYGAHDRAFFRALMGPRLWTPMPGASTHCMEEFLSPLVNWHEISDAYSK